MQYSSIVEIRKSLGGKWYIPKWYRRFVERKFLAQRRKLRTGTRIQGER